MKYSGPKVPFEQLIVGARGRRATNDANSPPSRASVAARWRDRWKPPQNMTTDFRLLPGSYTSFEDFPQAYYSYVEHFVAGVNKSLICSKMYKFVDGRLTTIGGKCIACDLSMEDNKNVGWRVLHAFNGIHLAWYHEVPAVDRITGRPKMYERGPKQGKPITDMVPCEGRRCKLCADGVPKTFGRKVHWSIGNAHLEQLGGIIKEISKDCVCGGRVTEVAYECPECGALLLEIDDPDAADIFGGQQHTCPKCKNTDFPAKQLECNKCQDPNPVSIFDCDLEIKRTGDKTASAIQIPRWVRKPLPAELQDAAKPWPLPEIFAPDSFETQALVLGVPNPYENEQVSAHAASYEDPPF